MEKLFTISQTAKMVGMTAETLRHYDRIGLVKPHKTDEWTGYRYYSNQEIVRLNTINALQYMDLSLKEIKNILEYTSFEKIIEILESAEITADNKIAELNRTKIKIQRAKVFYENKLINNVQDSNFFKMPLPKRVIMLANDLSHPTLDNLWDYHRHFFSQISEEQKDEFSFEDLAGIYTADNKSNLFAICTKYENIDGLKVLPKGTYLCANCEEKTREQVLNELIKQAKEEFNVVPEFFVSIVVLTGILKWQYQVQVLIEEN